MTASYTGMGDGSIMRGTAISGGLTMIPGIRGVGRKQYTSGITEMFTRDPGITTDITEKAPFTMLKQAKVSAESGGTVR